MVANRRLKVMLLDLPFPRFSVQPVDFYPPLAAASLKAMAHGRGLLTDCDIQIPMAPAIFLAGDGRVMQWILDYKPQVLGLSLYPWNITRSLYIATKAKESLPDLCVVVGGCEVQYDAYHVLRHPAVDVAVLGEGELTFTEILEHYLGGATSPPQVQGTAVCYDGQLQIIPRTERLENLDDIPSPLLLGYIDPQVFPSVNLETMRYCPFRCSYCTFYKRGKGSQVRFSVERLREEFAYAHDHGARKLAFFDAALNASPDFEAICEALGEVNYDKSMSVFADIQPELVDAHVADLLVRANLTEAEVGLQSTNPTALRNVRRPFRQNLYRFLRGVRELRQRGVNVFVNLMIGLPGETLHSVREALQLLADNELRDAMTSVALSVGMGSDLRKRADKFGIVYQQEAPYRVLRTAEMSFAEIREALKECGRFSVAAQRQGSNIRPVPYLHSNGANGTAGIEDCDRTGSAEIAYLISTGSSPPFPVSRVVLEDGCGEASDASVDEIGEYLACHAARTLTVFASGGADSGLQNCLNRLLARISTLNPFITYNIVLSGVRRQDVEMLREIAGHLHGQTTVLDREMVYLQDYTTGEPLDHIRASTRFFLLVPADRIDRDWPGIVWGPDYTVMDVATVAWHGAESLEAIRCALEHMCSPCVLVDFPAEMGPTAVTDAMELIHGVPGRERAAVRFTRWQHQHVWSVQFEKRQYVTLEYETVVRLDRCLRGKLSSLTREKILGEMAAWIILQRRRRRAGVAG